MPPFLTLRALAKLKLGRIYSILEYPLALGHAALFNTQPAVAYHGQAVPHYPMYSLAAVHPGPALAPNPLRGFFATPTLFPPDISCWTNATKKPGIGEDTGQGIS
jgi:hypothetical protein